MKMKTGTYKRKRLKGYSTKFKIGDLVKCDWKESLGCMGVISSHYKFDSTNYYRISSLGDKGGPMTHRWRAALLVRSFA
jgi:hypothetical protein